MTLSDLMHYCERFRPDADTLAAHLREKAVVFDNVKIVGETIMVFGLNMTGTPIPAISFSRRVRLIR